MRAQEQLEGLERLLTNPLAAANAMVYFQLRHLWRVGAQRLEQFGTELQTQREKRERAQLQDAEIAKRKRRLEAVKRERSRGLTEKRRAVDRGAGAPRAESREHERLMRLFRARRVSSARSRGSQSGRQMLEEKLEELQALTEKIQGEPLPEPEGLSLDSRRLINTAVIALAQHLVVHFSEHDLGVAREDVDGTGRRRHEVRRPARLRSHGRAHTREDRGAEAAEDASLTRSSGGRTCCSPKSNTATRRTRCRASSALQLISRVLGRASPTSSSWRGAPATRRCASTSSRTTTGTCCPSCAERVTAPDAAASIVAISATIRAALSR